MPSASFFDHFDDRFFYLSIVNRQRSGGRIVCCIDNPLLLHNTRARAIRDASLDLLVSEIHQAAANRAGSITVRASHVLSRVCRQRDTISWVELSCWICLCFNPSTRTKGVCSWSGLFRFPSVALCFLMVGYLRVQQANYYQ